MTRSVLAGCEAPPAVIARSPERGDVAIQNGATVALSLVLDETPLFGAGAGWIATPFGLAMTGPIGGDPVRSILLSPAALT